MFGQHNEVNKPPVQTTLVSFISTARSPTQVAARLEVAAKPLQREPSQRRVRRQISSRRVPSGLLSTRVPAVGPTIAAWRTLQRLTAETGCRPPTRQSWLLVAFRSLAG